MVIDWDDDTNNFTIHDTVIDDENPHQQYTSSLIIFYMYLLYFIFVIVAIIVLLNTIIVIMIVIAIYPHHNDLWQSNTWSQNDSNIFDGNCIFHIPLTTMLILSSYAMFVMVFQRHQKRLHLLLGWSLCPTVPRSDLARTATWKIREIAVIAVIAVIVECSGC